MVLNGALTLTDDITDPRLAKALAHPLRIEILRRLDERTASPSELAAEVDAPLTHVSYHVRKLASLGLIELVRKRPKRGVVEHYYSARRRQRVTDQAWKDTPRIVKRALAEAAVGQATEYLRGAAHGGGFDKDGAHFSRTALKLDRAGWKECVKIVNDALAAIERVESEAAERLEGKPDVEVELASAMLILLEAPPEGDGDGGASATKPAKSRSRTREPVKAPA